MPGRPDPPAPPARSHTPARHPSLGAARAGPWDVRVSVSLCAQAGPVAPHPLMQNQGPSVVWPALSCSPASGHTVFPRPPDFRLLPGPQCGSRSPPPKDVRAAAHSPAGLADPPATAEPLRPGEAATAPPTPRRPGCGGPPQRVHEPRILPVSARHCRNQDSRPTYWWRISLTSSYGRCLGGYAWSLALPPPQLADTSTRHHPPQVCTGIPPGTRT